MTHFHSNNLLSYSIFQQAFGFQTLFYERLPPSGVMMQQQVTELMTATA